MYDIVACRYFLVFWLKVSLFVSERLKYGVVAIKFYFLGFSVKMEIKFQKTSKCWYESDALLK